MYSQQPPPPNYAMMGNQYGGGGGPPPPYYQPRPPPPPRYGGSGRRRSRSWCMRFICCCYCSMFILLLMLAITLSLIYAFLNPKMPIYKLDDFTVNSFSVQPDMTVAADIILTVRAENPNTKIGFLYGKDSLVSVTYDDFVLCQGKIPLFYQQHGNVTVVDVRMTGRTALGPGSTEALVNDDRQGRIPLVVLVRAPVTVVLDTFPLRQFYVRVNCYLVVDGLKPDKKPKILSIEYKFGFGR